MVSGKDDAVCFSDGYPTGSLKGLCCLVDKECGKSPAGQDTVVTADQCGSDDPCPRKQIFIDLLFQLRGRLPQMIDAAACSFPFRVTAFAHPVSHFPDRFTYSPEFGIGRMPLETAFVSK